LDRLALQTLRHATRAAHQQLEDSLHVGRADAGRDDFLSYLRALHAWQAGFEARLWQAAWPDELEASSRAGKVQWMRDDLQASGVTPLEGAPPYEPVLNSVAQRVGLAYVVEGAQLGTQVLARRLAGRLGGWQPRWLHGYGQETGARWKSFTSVAEALLDNEEERQEAAQAARAAFESLSHWFLACGAASACAAEPAPSASSAPLTVAGSKVS
jgi:heme oxygenase (biliverdin-IX-beta and delta-forming)